MLKGEDLWNLYPLEFVCIHAHDPFVFFMFYCDNYLTPVHWLTLIVPARVPHTPVTKEPETNSPQWVTYNIILVTFVSGPVKVVHFGTKYTYIITKYWMFWTLYIILAFCKLLNVAYKIAH